MAFPKLFAGDLKIRVLSVFAPRLTIANHFAARCNVSRENLVDAGNHRLAHASPDSRL